MLGKIVNSLKYLLKFMFTNKELFKYLKLIFFLINNGGKLMKYNYKEDVEKFIFDMIGKILKDKSKLDQLDFVNKINKSNIDFNGFYIDGKDKNEISFDIFGKKVTYSINEGSVRAE